MPFLELRASPAGRRGRPQKCLAHNAKEIFWAMFTSPKRLGQRGAVYARCRVATSRIPASRSLGHGPAPHPRARTPRPATRRRTAAARHGPHTTFDNRGNAAYNKKSRKGFLVVNILTLSMIYGDESPAKGNFTAICGFAHRSTRVWTQGTWVDSPAEHEERLDFNCGWAAVTGHLR